MTDSIGTNTYTSNQYISGSDAAALEEQTENKMIAGLSTSDLTDINIKLTKGQALDDADVKKLTDMMAKVGGDFTAKDLDVLVQQGKLSRADADLVLAYSSIDGFHDGNATAADLKTGLNNIFVNMSDKDREFTLGLLANQGDYKRTLNVTVGSDGSKTASYTLSANGEQLSPGDLPSTPAIERAMMAVTEPTFDATKPGAIKAFANWEFDTSRDELGALLGGMKSYENLSATQKAELMTYLGSSGMVAAGYPFAATSDPKDIVHHQFMKDVATDYATGIKKLEELQQRGGLVHLDKEKITGADGKEMTLTEFFKERGIAFSNIDRDNTLGTKELTAAIANAKRFEQVHTGSLKILDMKLKGEVSGDQLKAMENNIAAAFEGARALNQFDAIASDHRLKGWTLDMDHVKFSHGGKTMSFAQFADQHGILHDNQRSNRLNPHEMTEFRNNMEHRLRNIFNDQAILDNKHKTDAPGGKKALDDLQNGIYRQQDIGKMMEIVRNEADKSGQAKIKDIMIDKTDGSGRVSLEALLKEYGVTYEDKGRKGVINNDRLREINGKLEGLYTSQMSSNEGFKTALNNVAVPKPEQNTVTTRNTDGGNNAVQMSNVNNFVQNGQVDFSGNNGFAEGVLSQGLAQNLNWDSSKEHSFQSAVNSAKDEISKGNSPSPGSILDKFGLSDSETIDIGLLMFVVQSERIKLLGDQIQDIIKEQRKNTRDQQDMQAAMQAVNSAEGNLKLKETKITLQDGTSTDLASFFDSKGVTYKNKDGDFTLGKEEKELLISNIKGKNEGLSNEGQAIMNELTMLSQKYQQAQSLAMNFLEKFDAMKQKIIDKIRAN